MKEKDRMSVIDRPIFIIGVDHSGTTILYRMLAKHPELAWFSQYSLRGGGFPGRMRVPFHGWVNRTGRALIPFSWHKKERSPFPEPREGAGIWRRLIPRREGFLRDSDFDEDMAARVREAFRSDLDTWRLERMLIKIPYLTRAVQVVDRIFPDALYVHIVRDGKAVALSNRARFAQGGLTPDEALRVSALRWVDTLEYVLEAQKRLGSRLMTLRYEDFCTDVHGWLRDILRFAGLDPDLLDTGRLPRTLAPTNERWLGSCPESEARTLDDLLSSTLVPWGYEPFSANGANQEAAPSVTMH